MLAEDAVEHAALEWLAAQGWIPLHGPSIAPGEPGAERADYTQVILEARLRDALARLNPTLPAEALDEARRRLLLVEGAILESRNRAFHRLLVDGVAVEYRQADGALAGAHLMVIDFSRPAENDLLAVNQFTVVDAGHRRRPDVILFVNGIPLVLLELKSPSSESATV